MSDEDFRKERIEKLLNELVYEVRRGIMEREIGEEMTFHYILPISNKIPNGVVVMRFITRPMPRDSYTPDPLPPRLHIVK